VFQHRNMLKWRVERENKRVSRFTFEDEWSRLLNELAESPAFNCLG
jgi:hypothetical protein